MNLEDIYSEYVSLVVNDGDCWHWLGDVAKVGQSVVAVVRSHGRTRDILRGALALTQVIATTQETYYRACDTTRCMNPDHYAGSGTEIAVMVAIRDRTFADGDCLIWTGQASGGSGTPVLKATLNGVTSRMGVRSFVYEVEHNVKLGPLDVIVPRCRVRKCVSPKHLVIKPATVREDTPSDDMNADGSEARRAYARLFMNEANKKLMREYA